MNLLRPCGLMDKAADFESEDCGFESHRGRYVIITAIHLVLALIITYFFKFRETLEKL